MTKSSAHNLIKSVAFCLILGALLAYAGAVLKPPTRLTGLGGSWPGFLKERDNSIDVLFLGNSHLFDGIDPSVLWRAEGIPSYILGGPTQRLSIAKYNLLEALHTQRPRVVVVDASTLAYSGFGDVPFQLVNVGYMPVSLNRVRAAFTAIEPEQRVSALVDLWTYHSRWNELGAKDFRISEKRLGADYLKGYVPQTTSIAITPAAYVLTKERREAADKALTESLVSLKEIADICDEQGIELLLLSMPTRTTGNFDYYIAHAKQSLRTNDNVHVLNLGAADSVPGISYEKDFFDGGHLTYRGAEKVSAVVADYLTTTYRLPDRRQNPAYADRERSAVERDRYIVRLLKKKGN